MRPCRVCLTLYPEIMPEVDDICRDCLSEPEIDGANLYKLAVEMERELGRWQRDPVPAVAEVRGR